MKSSALGGRTSECPSAFLACSVLLSVGPMHWLIPWREKANVVSCLVIVRHLDKFLGVVPCKKRERARSPGLICKSANVKLFQAYFPTVLLFSESQKCTC